MESVPLATITGAISCAGVLRTTGPARQERRRQDAAIWRQMCPAPFPLPKIKGQLLYSGDKASRQVAAGFLKRDPTLPQRVFRPRDGGRRNKIAPNSMRDLGLSKTERSVWEVFFHGKINHNRKYFMNRGYLSILLKRVSSPTEDD